MLTARDFFRKRLRLSERCKVAVADVLRKLDAASQPVPDDRATHAETAVSAWQRRSLTSDIEVGR